MTFNKIAQQVPFDKRGKIVSEIWFPTLFHFIDILNYEERNKKWLKHIFKWRDDDNKGIVRSNSRGWHSAVDMHHRKEFNYITKELFKMQREIFDHEGYDVDTEAYCDNMWANVSQFGAHNRNHTHPGSHFSFVYYLQSPEKCGQIWFSDPRAQAIAVQLPYNPKKPRLRETLNEVYWAPVPGRLIMFPSWAVHEVEPNLSELKGKKGLRVSVSGNLSFRYKKDATYKEEREGHDAKGFLTMEGAEKRT